MPPVGKLHVRGKVLPRRAEEHRLVVCRERARHFTRRVIREPLRLAASRRHDEHVEAAVAVRCECHRLTIVAPHRREFVRLAQRQRNRIPARCRHRPDVTLVFEEQRLAVGRNRRVAQPRRCVLSAHRGETRDENKSTGDGFLHSVGIIHTAPRR